MSATGYDIDARKVSRAKFDALVRLAKFLNAPMPNGACRCGRCWARLVDVVRRRLA